MSEFVPLVSLLDIGLDDLNPGDGLRQPGVHHPKLLLPGHADRVESSIVIDQGDNQRDEEDTRDQQQLGGELADHDDGNNRCQGRVNNQHQPGAEHQIEHAHVVGGAGHDIPNPLPPVKGLALAQQADVEFIAGVALDALGQKLTGIVARQPGYALSDGRRYHAQGQRQQHRYLPTWGGDQVKSTADKDLDVAVSKIVEDGGQEHEQREERVTHGVRDNPAHRPGAIVLVFVL